MTVYRFKKTAATAAEAPGSGDTDPPRRRRARSVNVPPAAGCPRGRWVDFDDECESYGAAGRAPAKPRSPKKITALPASMRPHRRRSASTNATDPPRWCGCDCHAHHHQHANPHLQYAPDPWPAITRNRSDTTWTGGRTASGGGASTPLIYDNVVFFFFFVTFRPSRTNGLAVIPKHLSINNIIIVTAAARSLIILRIHHKRDASVSSRLRGTYV